MRKLPKKITSWSNLKQFFNREIKKSKKPNMGLAYTDYVMADYEYCRLYAQLVTAYNNRDYEDEFENYDNIINRTEKYKQYRVAWYEFVARDVELMNKFYSEIAFP